MPSISCNINMPSTWDKNSYTSFLNTLIKMADSKYRDFNMRITPTNYPMIGIKVPILRKIAKDISKTNIIDFLDNSGNKYFEEILLKGIVIGYFDSYDLFLKYFNDYLEYIDNWAICDLFVSSCKIIAKNKDEFLKIIDSLIQSQDEFKIRVGIVCLLNYYTDDKKYLDYCFEASDKIDNNSYYVNMANAWLVSILFCKNRVRTLAYLKDNNLNDFTQNKAISKIRESFRVSAIDKKLVLKYKRAKKI